jgi:hypothetical protein
MFLLVLRAYVKLVFFDLFVTSGNFAALYRKVRTQPVVGQAFSAGDIKSVSHAVDIACICYPKRVLCLQRSAATACLMKTHGIPAQVVIGASQMPFRSHAWVEVAGRAVNDKPYVREMYAVLDCC